MAEVTRILKAIEDGDPNASDKLLPLVYDELRVLAAAKLRHEKPGQTLQPTALLHEAYLKLIDKEQEWKGRAHFFGAAAEAMRRILVDQARRKKAAKNAGKLARKPLNEAEIATPDENSDILAVHEALDLFEKIEPQAATLVKLRYFSGFTVSEAAEALGISSSTADRQWSYARVWLHAELATNQH